MSEFYALLGLLTIEAPNQIRARTLHAKELLLETLGLGVQILDCLVPIQIGEELGISDVDRDFFLHLKTVATPR